MKIHTLFDQCILVTVLCFILTLISTFAFSQSQSAPQKVDQLTKQWLDLAQSSNQLSQDWQAEKQQLALRIALLKEENKSLTEQIKQANNQQDHVNVKRRDILAEQSVLEQQVSEYRTALPGIVNQLQALMSSLPPYLAEQLSNELAQLALAKNGQQNQLTKQYQTVASIIQQVAKAAQLIQVKQGLIKLGDRNLLTEQLYFGNDQAWFVTRDNSLAGVGFRQLDSWQWQLAENSSAEIRQAISYAKSQAPGPLLALPVKLGAQ